MMCIAKRITACFLMLLVLMLNTALADTDLLVFSKSWDLASQGLDVLLKAEVKTHMPFDANRLATLTPITDMLSLRLITGENEGAVVVSFDAYDVLSLQYHENAVQISSVPDTTFVSDNDAISQILGSNTSVANGYEALGLAPDGEQLIIDGRALLTAIPEAMASYGARSKNDTNISGYGKSAYRIDYTIAASKVDEISPLLLSICPDGWLKEIITGLTFSGKQTLRMYFTADDVLLRAEYNGVCGPADNLRTVKLVVRTKQSEDTDKIYIELTSPAKSGKNKNNLTFERTVETNNKGQRVIQGEFNYTVILDGVTSVRKGEFDLKNAWTETADVISGSVIFENKLNGAEKASTLTLAPDIVISGTATEPSMKGTITVTETYAGRTTEQAILTIEVTAAEALEWDESSNIIYLDTLDAVQMNNVQQEVAASVATAIVQPLIVMMGEEAQWFFLDLPEEAVQTLIDTAQMTNE